LSTVPAAGNITETAVDDIPTVTGATAMTLFVRQPKNLRWQSAIHKIKIIRSPPLTSHWNSSFHAIYKLYTVVATDKSDWI